MTTFSFWTFEKFKTLDEIIETLKENNNKRIIVNDLLWNYDNPIVQFRENDNYGIDVVKTVDVNGKKINFIYFEGYTERIANKSSWLTEAGTIRERNELVNEYKCNIMFFEYNNTVQGVFFRAKSTAQRIISYLFGKEEIWGTINEMKFGITEDLFYWVFHRVKDYSDEPLYENIDMNITGFESYRGTTKDNVNAIKGQGSRIAAMLGTIAFLFNNENLKAITPEIQYKNNKVLIDMSISGTYKIWDNKYIIGDLVDADELLQKIKLVIYASLELIPKFIECYKMNCAKKQWSPQMKLNFLKTLGNEITDKVNVELERIKEQISEEFANENEEYEIDEVEDEDEDDIEENLFEIEE
ncbi:hypothetical protein [Clostridium botulinum]|uniref:hypothetical protein n=1 Tax=Clostridium botulinum TaxID=1491 RepID=UPI000774DD3B|nr:hypothetical protein [Clostridium botulinum]MBY6931270.1 hypothetical protein [Clostridium botulinum]NFG19792.1 hypothetical protein [Clostridium botulinum]NFO79886.1 hypothetical protein [Clostridium botulinum]